MMEVLNNQKVYLGTASPESGGGGQTINNEDITITENGVYTASAGYTGIGTATVNVTPVLSTLNATTNGTYTPTSPSVGFSSVVVNTVEADIVTATNTMTSAISAGDKVWLEKRGGGGVEDFSKYNSSNFTITNGIMNLSANGSGTNGSIYKLEPTAFNTPQQYVEVVLKFQPRGWSNGTTFSTSGPVFHLFGNSFSVSNNKQYASSARISIYTPGTGDNLYKATRIEFRSGNSNVWGNQVIIPGEYINTNTWFWVKVRVTSSNITASWSYDGINWTQTLTASGNYLSSFAGYTQYYSIGGGVNNNSQIQGCFVDLYNCYVKADDIYWWEPYKDLQPDWYILSYLKSSIDSFTGIAQENIAISGTGEVKTVLPGMISVDLYADVENSEISVA